MCDALPLVDFKLELKWYRLNPCNSRVGNQRMMKFFKQTNKQTKRYNSISYVDQSYATGYVRQNANTSPRRLEMQMLNTERNHPFYPDWPEWQRIVEDYHSERIKKISAKINKGLGFDYRDTSPEEHYLINETTFLCTMCINGINNRVQNGEQTFEQAVRSEFKDMFTCLNIPSSDLKCDCGNFMVGELTFPSRGCPMSHLHNQAHILSIMWAYVYIKKPRKCIRKYFTRLERVVLSLRPSQLLNFNLDYILKPKEFAKYGRPLLKDLYLRGFLDKELTVNQIATQCEYLKHFIPKQQDGFSCQSERGAVFDEMLILAEKLFSRDNSVMDYLCLPRQQGFLTLHNQHTWDEANLEKIKLLIDNARSDFFSSFKETMVDCSKTLVVLFIAASIVALLARIAIGASAILVYKLIHLICSFVCGVEDREEIRESLAQQQSGETPEEITDMPILPRLITKYIIDPPTQLLGTIWTSKETDRIMKRISYLGDSKIENGLDRIMSWIKRVLRRTQAWFMHTFLGIDMPADLDGDDHAINKWNEEVDTLIDSYYSNELVWTEATWSVLHNLYSRGLAFTRSKAYARYRSDVWRVVSKLGNLLEQFKKHNKDGQSIRNPPVTIYLYGDTGVGKSALTYPLAIHLLKEIFAVEKNPIDLKEHWKNLIYMRSAEQEYWDGYENQLVTLFDDFNQQIDSGANPSIELFEIIRASNCFPYPLHMASIEQKATTNFTSKIIIVSTNNERPKTQSLNFPTALQRRFDISVKVTRKRDVKLEKGAKFSSDIYQFERYDMVSGSELGTLSFKELVDLGTMEYFSRSKFVDSIDEYIENILRVETPKPPKESFDEVDNPFKVEEQGGFKCFQMTEMKSNEDAALEGILYNHAKSWHEQLESRRIELSKPLFSRIKDKFYSWWDPSPMDSLRQASAKLRKTAAERLTWFKSLKQRFPFIEKMKTPLCLVLAGLSFIALFYGIKKLFSKNKVKTEKEVLTPLRAKAKSLIIEARSEGYSLPQPKQVRMEGYNPAVVKTAKVEGYNPAIVRPVRAESIPRKEAIEQGIRDVNAAEIMMKIARTNVYKMYESTHGAPIGHIFFLRGRVAVMPKHYMYALKQSLANDSDATIYFEAIALSRCFQIRVADLLDNIQSYESPDESDGPVYTRDLMAVAVPSAIVHTDAVPYIADKKNFSYVDYTSVMLPVLAKNNLSKSDKAVLLLRYAEGRSQLRKVNELPVGDSETPVLRIVRDVWEYNMDTQTSECGAPLIVRNKEIAPGKVCGIHIAGINGTGEGFSTPFYREDAEKILKSFEAKFTMQQSFRMPLQEYPKQQCQVPEDAEFIRLGSLCTPIAQPSKSKVVPSLVYGKIREPVTKPCALGPRIINGEAFDPRSYRISRLGNVPEALDVKLINNSKEAFIDEMSGVFARGVDKISVNIKNKYTFEEAVLGIEGELFINAVKRNTSAGYPFVKLGKTRYDYFGKEAEYDLDNVNCQELKARVTEIIDCALKGIVLDHYFMDTLKDERKPIHKAHKTRLFSAGPLDYLIACKMYFNGIVALISEFRNKCHISVGTNPYSQDWGRIARLMKAKSSHVVAGDFEGFDASQHQMLLEAAGEVLIILSQRFLGSTEEDAQIMRVLMVSLINSLHITGKEVYQWTHSLPSGHYLTAIINSIFVNISFGCIWQLAFNQVTYAMARSLWDECGLVAYGDDHILSVPLNRLDAFNQLNIPDLFTAIGLSYTMEDKDAVAVAKSRNIEQISYLKRRFMWDEQAGIWLAPLSLDTVLETPMWMHKCPDPRQQTIANLEWALKELSLHEPCVWGSWSPVLRNVGQELGHYTMLIDQNHARVVCLSQDFEM